MAKRRDLLRRIRREARKQGLSFERAARKGGNHEIRKSDGLMIPVPRHNEIGDLTAMGIYKEAAEKLGKEWWLMIYRVEIEPDGKYWNISVPQIQRVTQARTLGEVESMAKDLISIMTEERDPQIEVQMHLPSLVEEALRLKIEAKEAERRAQQSMIGAVRLLHDEGVPYREIGQIMGISHQRAQQLVSA